MTLCAWCGKPLKGPPQVRYEGEYICLSCYEGRDKSMENWQRSLDDYLSNPPEGRVSKCRCARCGDELYPDDSFFDLDDEIMCERCAEAWLEDQRDYVSESMAYD